ncbi:MAG TPA: hypothetical protein VG714_03725 [Acidobacteriaceae bacterium]|nr:hypothetical protein [Acidobacteriaceae bacterium]
MNEVVPPHNAAEVEALYRQSVSQQQQVCDTLASRHGFAIKLIAALLIAAVLISVTHLLPAFRLLIASATALLIVFAYFLHLQSQLAHNYRILEFRKRNLARASGLEVQSGHTGLEPDQDRRILDHLYEHDLNILGSDSLFGLLATVRTSLGERGLADYLLRPATPAETIARQQAVQELLPHTHLREQIAMLGSTRFQRISASLIDAWLDAEAPQIHSAFRIALFATVAANLLLLLAGIGRLLPWGTVRENIALTLAVQGAIALSLRQRLSSIINISAALQHNTRLVTHGIALMQAASFRSPKLIDLQRLTQGPPAAISALKRLDNSLLILEQRAHPIGFVLSLLLAGGTQAAIFIASWKRRHIASMRLWLDAWSEFEALNALASFAFEHPEYTWPELLPPDHPPTFHATALSHPLLPDAIPNDIALDDTTRFYLISGSNMSGKSTLLRAIGVNAVLAYAGAPVCAASLRLTPLTLGASIALTDSLAEGRSKFLAEVKRLGAILHPPHAAPVLFLVDEIFSGTNSEDRRTAAHAILRQLLAAHAIGALSTHDLALASLVTQDNAGRNVHMASPDAADPLAFDYKLKPGINTASSAQAILHMMGIET